MTGEVRQLILTKSFDLVVLHVGDPETGPLGRLFQLTCLAILGRAEDRPLNQSGINDQLASLTPETADSLNLGGVPAEAWARVAASCTAEPVVRTLRDRVGGSEPTSFQSEWISRVLNPLLELACVELRLDWIAVAGKPAAPKWAGSAPASAGTGWQLIWYRKNRREPSAAVQPTVAASEPSPVLPADAPAEFAGESAPNTGGDPSAHPAVVTPLADAPPRATPTGAEADADAEPPAATVGGSAAVRPERKPARRRAVAVAAVAASIGLAALIVWRAGEGGQASDPGRDGGDAERPPATRPATALASTEPTSADPEPTVPARPTSLPSPPDGKLLFEEADRDLAANRFRLAEAKFAEATRWTRGEKLAMSYLGRGQARCALGDFDGAIEDLKRAAAGLSGQGVSDSNKRIVAVCYQRRAEAFRGGVRDPALRANLFVALDKGIRLIPAHPKLNCLEAEYWMYDRSDPDRKDKANTNLALALRKENYAHASFLRAVWHFKAAEYELAARWCDTAAAEDDQFAAPRQLRADALDRLGRDPQSAAADRARAAELDRANPGRALAGAAVPWLEPWP